MNTNTGHFEIGNQAAKTSKRAVAEMIREKMETEQDTAQFAKLAREYNTLTKKRRRRRREKSEKPEAKKLEFGGSFADSLPEEEKVILREIIRIEEEQRQGEQAGIGRPVAIRPTNVGCCVVCDAQHATMTHPTDGQPVCQVCYEKALMRRGSG